MNLPVIAQTLPQGACALVTDLQSMLDLFSSHQFVSLPSASVSLVASQTAPIYDPNNTVLWQKLDQLNRPIRRLYSYAQGYWLSEYPVSPGGIILCAQAVNTVELDGILYCDFDGGELAAPTLYSGAFYQIALGGYFPIGVGTTPAPNNTTIELGEEYGEEEHTLDVTEIPAHTHGGLPKSENDSTSGGDEHAYFSGGTVDSASTGGGLPHNNMPQAQGVYFLQRTIRRWYAEAAST
jgi:hypothetical protein